MIPSRMKTAFLLAVALGSLNFLKAEPLAEGAFVDIIIVPVGSVALAEFETDTPPAAAAGDAAKPGAPAKPQGPGGGGGSGIRVKQQDPSEIPPSAVFVRQSASKYFQIPCSQNAVSSPVRTPVSDTDVVLYQRMGDGGSSFKELGRVKVTKSDTRMLVLLTKPLKEKRWDSPTVSFFPLPKTDRPQLVFANASQELQCGVKVATNAKALEPLKPLIWESPTAAAAGVDVSLAMRDLKGASMPPFYQSNVELKANTTTLIIPYSVTQEESFRGGKLATGIIDSGTIRQATPYEVAQ